MKLSEIIVDRQYCRKGQDFRAYDDPDHPANRLLIQSFKDNGWLPNEPLVIFQREGKNYLCVGFRRVYMWLAALLPDIDVPVQIVPESEYRICQITTGSPIHRPIEPTFKQKLETAKKMFDLGATPSHFRLAFGKIEGDRFRFLCEEKAINWIIKNI